MSSVKTQCPNIVPQSELIINEDNIPQHFECSDETVYTYYSHCDAYGREHGEPRVNVQFCKRIGRKRDVFQCLNESEWRQCYAYRDGD